MACSIPPIIGYNYLMTSVNLLNVLEMLLDGTTILVFLSIKLSLRVRF
jgi:hypothetical protein